VVVEMGDGDGRAHEVALEMWHSLGKIHSIQAKALRMGYVYSATGYE